MNISKISDAPTEEESLISRDLKMKIEKFDKITRILDATITPKASKPRNADQIKTSICSVEDKADKTSSYNRFVYDEEDAEGITVDRSSGVGPDIYLFDDEE